MTILKYYTLKTYIRDIKLRFVIYQNQHRQEGKTLMDESLNNIINHVRKCNDKLNTLLVVVPVLPRNIPQTFQEQVSIVRECINDVEKYIISFV